jgi:hypothetical protein
MLKVGDRIKINSLDWYNSKEKDPFSDSIKLDGNDFVTDMIEYLGKEAVITRVFYHKGVPNYCLDIDGGDWGWTDEMFEKHIVNCFEVYQFGDLFVRVDIVNKIVFPDFYLSLEEARSDKD